MALFRDLVNAGNTFEGKTVVLKNDIDLEGSKNNQWTPIGTNETPFEGVFDGNNKTIQGLYMDRSDIRWMGLFMKASKGEIKRIKIQDCYMNSTWNNPTQSAYIGGIVGWGENVKQCSVTGSLSFNYEDDVIVDTWILAIGGIIGSASINLPDIQECYNGANILIFVKKTSSTATTIYAGGITSLINNGTIKDCYNDGDITIFNASTQKNLFIGGVAGINHAVSKIENAYNLGTINAVGDVGGILGKIGSETANINNCYYLNNCGGSNVNGGIAVTQGQIQKPTFANILNKKETYSNTLDWTSKYQEGEGLPWRYKGNRTVLKWQMD